MELHLDVGLSTEILQLLEKTLQEESVSREFHALCHLCSSDAPAAVKLSILDKEALLQLSDDCIEAVNQWCCCSREYEATRNAPSLTSRNSRLVAKVCSLTH